MSHCIRAIENTVYSILVVNLCHYNHEASSELLQISMLLSIISAQLRFQYTNMVNRLTSHPIKIPRQVTYCQVDIDIIFKEDYNFIVKYLINKLLIPRGELAGLILEEAFGSRKDHVSVEVDLCGWLLYEILRQVRIPGGRGSTYAVQ